jgi:hypothetical protein
VAFSFFPLYRAAVAFSFFPLYRALVAFSPCSARRNLFALPKWVRDGCAAEKRVMCRDTPVFLT